MNPRIYEVALKHLKDMLGPTATFRDRQYDAIEKVVAEGKSTLVVQPTGWGKSIVYFIATRILRDEGKGPALLISPLISLMRNQIKMAERIGVKAYTMNSQNYEEWGKVKEQLSRNQCDILLVAPEKLGNKQFLSMLKKIENISLLVIDEAHCISDWGHDFRPDYRRIRRLIELMPPNIPVLCTTATANNRVIQDIQEQLGENLLILRGSLTRKTLFLQNIFLKEQCQRLAWLAENLPKFKGSGIVYCLTIPDALQVTRWLKSQGISAEAYTSRTQKRETLEQEFLKNRVKVLVATVALGMGFDKPDISFVIHYQRPASVIHYYQQIGRAGRGIQNAYCILLSGDEDTEIQNYFIESAFPSFETLQQIHNIIFRSKSGVRKEDIQKEVNVSNKVIDQSLKILEIERTISNENNRYTSTRPNLILDIKRIKQITELRRKEQIQMLDYLKHSGCLMRFLQEALDDSTESNCGHCANCVPQKRLPVHVSDHLVQDAKNFLRNKGYIKITPTDKFPNQKDLIPEEYKNETGYSLCQYGDSGWGKIVKSGKYIDNHFSEDLVDASVKLIRNEWRPHPFPGWVTAIPSRRHPNLVPDFAKRLAQKLGIPYYTVLERIADAPPQKEMQNSYMQAHNVWKTIKTNQELLQQICSEIRGQPVLLVDDIIDSGWTLTIAGYLLRQSGSGHVFPFTLAKATKSDL